MGPTGRPEASAEPRDHDDASLIELGGIVNLHGIRGELRLRPHNPDTAALDAVEEITLLHRDGRREVRRVCGARHHKTFVLLTLDGVDSANAAQELVGCRVAIPRAALPPAGPNAAYHADLIGCRVVTTGGDAVGRIAEVLVTASNDICVVREAGREHLVPLIADVIAELDVSGGRVVIHPLPGLLESDEDEPVG